jgi:hypothetical protein
VPTAKQALCQQAWNEIQEMRKASTQDVHPFVAPASYSDDWMRGATDNQTVLLAWPNSFEEFEVETCGAKTSCSVPVAWQLRAATMRVDTSPTLQRYSDVFEPQGKGVRQGHESFGGLTTVYNGPSTVDPYYAHLEWMIFPEPATPSRERALTALGLPTNLPVRSEPLVFEGDVLPHTVAVSFGRTAAFSDRPHWGLAGLTMQAFSRTPPYVQAGFAYFAGPSDGPSPLTTFFERFAPITTNAVHVWDTNTHAFVPCQPNRRLPYAEQCGGVFASEIETLKNATLRSGEKLCATVLWSISGLSNPFASSACILPSGQFAEQGTEGVSMATLGLPSVAAIDALPSLP